MGCCKLCQKVIKYCGNTSNMKFHLREHHRTIFKSLPKEGSTKSTEKDTSFRIRSTNIIAREYLGS